ncbi:MAG: LysR family transcriptional regulator [Janthinobacterium lividum]
MKLDLNLLPIVLALAEEGTVTAAARRLNMSQPALSGALSKLRDRFQDPLFVRTGRGMEPTPLALRLLQPIRLAMNIVEHDILQPVEFEPARSSKVFTLAMTDVGEMTFVPPLLDHLRREAPGMSIRTVSPSSEQTERGLEVGDIDMAVGYFPDLKGNNFYQQRLFSHGFACLLRVDHPIRSARLTTKQFLAMGHAIVRAEGRSQEVFEKFLLKKGFKRSVVLSTSHFMSIPSIIARSDLVATVPLGLATAFSQMPSIRMVKPPYEIPKFDLRTHWHRKFHNDPTNRWLREVIAALFNDELNPWREPNVWLK